MRNDLLTEKLDRPQRFLWRKIAKGNVADKIVGSGRANLLIQKGFKLTHSARKRSASIQKWPDFRR